MRQPLARLISRGRDLFAAALAMLVVAGGVSCAEYIASPDDGTVRRVRSARVSQPTLTIDDGATARLTVELLDQFGVAFTGVPEGTTVTWESGDPTRLAVTDDGSITALRSGVASVSAVVRTLGAIRATAQVTIRQVPDRLEAVAGTAQSGTAGEALGQPIAVRLLDRRGDPMPDAEIRFTFDRDAGGTEGTTARTDATGVARATWTLAPRVLGTQRAIATTPLLATATVTFTATAAAGPVATLLAISGGGQRAAIETALPLPLVARALDRFGNPVAGASIAFAANAGQGRVAPGQATADADGRASATWTLGSAPGPVQATATSGSATPARFDATTTAGAVTQVAASPRTVTLAAIGATATLSAIARDARGNADPTAVPQYRSLDPAVATVDATGLVTAAANGTTRIVVTVQGVDPAVATDEVAVTVAQVPASVVITPATAAIAAGATRALTAVVRDARGNPVSGAVVTWSSADEAIATVDAAGVVTAVAAGATAVRARSTAGATTVEAAASITVTAPPATVVTIAPAPVPSLDRIGGTVQLTASVATGGVPVTGATVAWASLDPAVATVSPTGLVTAVANGTARITATFAGVTPAATATATVPVAQVPTSITVTPTTATIGIGATQAFVATARDAGGTVVPSAGVVWQTSAPGVATVSSLGVATGVAAGTATITASVSGASPALAADAALTVSGAALPTLSVAPAPVPSLAQLGATVPLTATVRDAAGVVVPGASVTWVSLDPAVATVSATGVVTAVGNGTARIT
nr:Ig-like domain-containing protein [Gemmatimonadaceae bacterium]